MSTSSSTPAPTPLRFPPRRAVTESRPQRPPFILLRPLRGGDWLSWVLVGEDGSVIASRIAPREHEGLMPDWILEHLPQGPVELSVLATDPRILGLPARVIITTHEATPFTRRAARTAVEAAETNLRAHLAADGTEPLVVATDASMRRTSSGASLAGMAWVTADGRHGTATATCLDIHAAEIAAVALAVRALASPYRDLVIRTDSRATVSLLRDALREGVVTRGSTEQRRTQHKILRSIEGSSVRLEWVRGHNGDQLNETADRLAVLARRDAEAVVAHGSHEERAARVVTEELAAA